MIFSLSYIECLIEPWAGICYWSFERTIYILVFVDWCPGACENECLCWCDVLYMMFEECRFICMWLALNNLFGRVLVHPLLLVICLFVHRIEKDQFIKEKQGNYKHVWDAISSCFKNTHSLIPPFTPLGVIHRWDSSSHCSTWI